jgi:hypothetical protein
LRRGEAHDETAGLPMTSRRALVFVLAAAGSAAMFVACTDLAGLSGAKDVADATTETGADVLDASPPEPVSDASAPVEDAESRDDASSTIDASGCTTCDCDNDSFVRSGPNCDAGGRGFDCDDLDPLIHPGQTFVDEPWTSKHVPAGDWDCNGIVTKLYNYGFMCSGINPSCSPTVAFTGDPACGQLAEYDKCVPSGINCAPMKIDLRRQACR